MGLARTSIAAGVTGLAVVGAASLGERILVRRIRSVDPPPGWTSPRFPEGRTLMVPTDDGAQLHVAIAGGEHAPTVVLVHGLTSNHDDWGPVAGPLVDAGLRVVGIDQRGHGGSTIGTAGFSVERLGADIGQVLGALDLDDVTLVGHSMGGVAAMALLLVRSETGADRVGRLVLVATLAHCGRVDRRIFLKLADRPRDRIIDHPVHRRAAARVVFGGTPSVAMVDDALASSARCPDEARIGASLALVDHDLRSRLADIAVPTTVVCGTRDRLTTFAENRRIAAAIPGARLVPVPGAGHIVPWEAPGAVVTAIGERVSADLVIDVT